MRKQPGISNRIMLKISTKQMHEPEEDGKSSFLYKLIVGLFTSLIPVFVIFFFDLYNKQYLSYYKVYDVKLSYSLDIVLKEILPSGII